MSIVAEEKSKYSDNSLNDSMYRERERERKNAKQRGRRKKAYACEEPYHIIIYSTALAGNTNLGCDIFGAAHRIDDIS